MRTVNDYLYSRGVLKYIDYNALGTSYEDGGTIIAEFSLYTDKAIHESNAIFQQRISLGTDNENVTFALSQIAAELENKLYITNKQTLLDEIITLDATPWETLDKLSYIDTSAIRSRHAPIYVTNSKELTKRRVHLSLELNNDFVRNHKELLPLFVVLSKVILHSTTHLSSTRYATYTDTLEAKRTRPAVFSKLLVLKDWQDQFNHGEIIKCTQDALENIYRAEGISRLLQLLQTLSYENDYSSPSYEDLFNATKVLTGANGWKQIANYKNISKVLYNTSIRIAMKGQTIQQPLRIEHLHREYS